MTLEVTAIRDQMFVLLGQLPGFQTVRKAPQRQLQPENLPSITVMLGEEMWATDGDANAGAPHFLHDATFHISVLRGFDDPVVLDGKSDADMTAIEEKLLRDPDLLTLFEGISTIRRSRSWPQQGDAYYAELRIEITVQYRTMWGAIAVNDFETMAVTAGGLPQQIIDLPGDTP